ncbi:MAG: hypothetical protein LC689_10560 [Myxococcales bacterium]|nr:hypothetical protein [Myxococcales bacterium]
MSLRPCGERCFLCFFTVDVLRVELASELPLIELSDLTLLPVLSPAAPVVEVPVAELSAGALTAPLLVEVLGSALVLPLCEFEMPAVPLSSPVELVLLEGFAAVFLLSSFVVVCARAPNAERASASAVLRMIFTWSPPW